MTMNTSEVAQFADVQLQNLGPASAQG
jgi:hypothetical protein